VSAKLTEGFLTIKVVLMKCFTRKKEKKVDLVYEEIHRLKTFWIIILYIGLIATKKGFALHTFLEFNQLGRL
jgi:hypothetical protein